MSDDYLGVFFFITEDNIAAAMQEDPKLMTDICYITDSFCHYVKKNVALQSGSRLADVIAGVSNCSRHYIRSNINLGYINIISLNSKAFLSTATHLLHTDPLTQIFGLC